MKKFYVYISIILLPLFGIAQSYNKTFMGSGGIFGDGYGGEIALNHNLSELTFTQIALDVSFDTFQSGEVSIPYSSYTLSYSYFRTVISSARREKSFSIGGGALVGYELANNGNNDLSNIVSLDGESKFIFGGVVTAEIDIIISEHFSAVVKTAEFYHANSDFGKFTNYSGAGLRYYFN